MKKTALLIFAASLLLFSCNNSADKDKTNSTDSTNKKETAKDDVKAPPMDSATMMKNWQAYMTPSDMHKMMASWDGTWTTDMTMWEKPGAPPTKSTGTSVNKMVLGGRYQESVNTSTMMGMPFEGHGTLGYDNMKKVIEGTWVDNMGTGIMKISGPWDAATKSATLTGKEMDPMSGKETDYKETFSVIDDNTQMMDIYGQGPDGKEFKMMEIKDSRKK
jgi:hypothetical protein